MSTEGSNDPIVEEQDIKKEEEVAPQVTKAAEPQSVSVAEKKAAPVSSKPLFAELKDIVKSHPCSASVSDILHWKDIVKSGLLFAIGNFYFFLICCGEYSVVTLSSYLLLALIGVSFGYAKFQAFKGNAQNALADRFKESDFGIPEETLKAHVQSLHLSLELARKLIVQVLYSNEPLFTIFSVLALLLVAIVGKIFGGLTLLYLAFIVAFAWPRAYQEKQALIDEQFAKVCKIVSEQLDKVLEKAPFLKAKKD